MVRWSRTDQPMKVISGEARVWRARRVARSHSESGQLKSGEHLALGPEPSRRAVILRLRARLLLAALVEVSAANAVKLGGRRDVGRRLSAALDGDRRDQLADRNAEAPDPAIVVAEAAGNEAGVQAIRCDAGSLEASSWANGICAT